MSFDERSTDGRAAFEAWRAGLINLSGSNRLISIDRARSGVIPVIAPDAATIVEAVQRDFQAAFVPADAEDAKDKGRTFAVRVGLEQKVMGASLRRLLKRAKQEYLDRGVSVLYLAVGMLRWADEDGQPYISPLLLLPVDLKSLGPRADPQMERRDDDPLINPALILRLRELGVTLPALESSEQVELQQLWRRVDEAIADRDGWRRDDSVVLSSFTFHKEAMFRDLLENEARALANPIVEALTIRDPRRQSAAFAFEPIAAQDIDRSAAPEDVPLVLDADSSQRACIAAAVAGRSFVMDGPPGTGKSQTIANMIGALLHAGRRVLFVSEKAAALEVVRNRLADIGLGGYLLELHSHQAGRKEVAAALADALDNVPVPPRGMDAVQRSTVRERRDQLNRYADAMNQVREPLKHSLHDVLGFCAKLTGVPVVPVDVPHVSELTPERLSRIADAADRLRRSWRPAVQQSTHLWRDVVDRDPLSARLQLASEALDALEALVAVNAELAAEFGLRRPGDAAALMRLIGQARGKPAAASPQWLTLDSLEPLESALDDLGEKTSALLRAEQQTWQKAGVLPYVLPAPESLPRIADLSGLDPQPINLDRLTASQATMLAARFAADALHLERQQHNLDRAADALRLPRPQTFIDADLLAGIVETARKPYRPEQFWFGNGALAAVLHAAGILRDRTAAVAAAEQNARRYFTDAALGEPLAELADRFHRVHRGMGRISGAYRRDKRSISGIVRPDADPGEAIVHLDLAVAWKAALDEYTAAEREMAPWLGRYWQSAATDFGALQQATRIAEEVLTTVPLESLPAVVAHVCRPDPDETLIQVVTEARDALAAWQNAAAVPRELLLGGVRDAAAWLRAHEGPLRAVAAVTTQYTAAAGREVDLGSARHFGELRETTARTYAMLSQAGAHYTELFGDAYRARETDRGALADAIAWTAETRRLVTGSDQPLTVRQTAALAGHRWTEALPDRYHAWRSACDRILAAFDPHRRGELLDELSEYDRARELLTDLRADGAGQEEWFTYLDAKAELDSYGLHGVVEFCAERRMSAEDVRPVVEATLFRAWADNVMRQDEALRPTGSEDREHLIDEYRRLDQELVAGAVSEIITAANARRPAASTVGEPALIRREGMRKRGHKPVRELIAQTRDTVLALKPCFMMSPLAVSQYLPADLEFDVVIFDEASQVTPGDAINCIYRGRALIAAGDDRQLPPTAFFERVVDEDADEDADPDVTDYQSILELSKACGAFPNLGLRWHYRSRHEALIAYSNHAFYGGRLVTFPSADAKSPDLGVELIKVDGVYRRGTSRDNPDEAAAVAERVVHHFATRPGLSLGVVAFSVAQAEAIDDAVDRAFEQRPDLEHFRDDDRLNGFFVKNLEAVQGDERDVVIFSIGYGPDEFGKMSGNFGALNRPKGWRRLNVAITRARRRIEVVSSVRAGDIPETRNPSVQHLVSYLDYAERGTAALALRFADGHRDTDSPFEDSVLETIRSWDYQVTTQVGTAGYRIDLGVRHPGHPGEVYALGVECDGVMYHSSPAARDRDRLREQILTGLGWNLHRIWGTAWYRHRAQEEQRLRTAIERAVAGEVTGRLGVLKRPAVTVEPVTVSLTWVEPYRKAVLDPLPSWVSVLDHDMAPALERLAAVEGPVHIAVVYQRMRDAWQIGRVGTQIRAAIEAAMRRAHVDWDGTFLSSSDGTPVTVRGPGDGLSRTVEQICDAELRLALTRLVTDGGTVTGSDLRTAAARVFGWSRTGLEIESRLSRVISSLVADGSLESDEHGYRGPRGVRPGSPSPLDQEIATQACAAVNLSSSSVVQT